MIAGIAASAATNFPVRAGKMVATIALTFDNYATTFSNAFFDMQSKGIPGTFFVDSSRIGQPGQPTKDNLVLMAANGWEIGARVYGTIGGTEANMVSVWNNSRLDAINRLKAQRDEMYAVGFDIKSIAASQRAWCAPLRGVASHLFDNVRVADVVGYGTLPVADRLYVREGGSESWSASDTIASLSAWLDGLIAAGPGALGIPVIHRVDSSGDPAYTVSTSVFQGFTSYLQSKIAAGVVRAVTFREAVAG